MSVGVFQPHWIQSGTRRLYAALHAGHDAVADGTAVLMAPPLLHEQYRTTRFLCELASCLAAEGMDCLRFNHAGSGDSEGDGADADLDTVASDIQAAAASLLARSRRTRLAVLGFGSSVLALPRWFAGGGSCDLLVLWDPVVDGAAWLAERVREDAAKRATIRPEPGMDCSDEDLMGVPVSARMREQIAAQRWSLAAAPAGTPVWQVLYSGQDALPRIQRPLPLPAAVPGFGQGVLMDASLLFSPPLERSARALGQAMAAA